MTASPAHSAVGAEATVQPLRVTMVQPSLAKYRLPVFQKLSQRPGLSVRVVYAEAPGIANVPPVGIESHFEPMWVGRLLGHPFYWQRSQLDWAARAKTDVLVLNWDVHYLTLVPALLRARVEGIGTLLWGHGYSKSENAARLWLRATVGRLASGLVLYNRAAAQLYSLRGDDRVFVAPNSMDTTAIEAARRWWLERPQQLAAFQREQGLGHGPVLLFVARLTPARRLDLLIEATATLTRQHPRLRVVIIGNGPERQALQSQTERLGLDGHVRFIGEVYDEQNLAPWFLSSTCFCFPRDIGLSLLHAFAYGLPVVTSDDPLGHGPEFEALREGHNGLLFRDGDVQSLASTVARVIEYRPLAAELSAGALATVREEYSLERMIRGLEQAIRAVAPVRQR